MCAQIKHAYECIQRYTCAKVHACSNVTRMVYTHVEVSFTWSHVCDMCTYGTCMRAYMNMLQCIVLTCVQCYCQCMHICIHIVHLSCRGCSAITQSPVCGAIPWFSCCLLSLPRSVRLWPWCHDGSCTSTYWPHSASTSTPSGRSTGSPEVRRCLG